ncbi:MAG TPA: hypothetical protein VGR57_01185 [Ktedonobacterales bacterium]|nr:hypothetical protein [Ktedonobacterales bacterium]
MTAGAQVASGGAPHRAGRRRRAVLAGAALAWLLLGALAPAPPVRADGGAPNLAYIVSRSASGNGGTLAALDIARRKVTWTTALAAAPTAVQLSVDGRTVFVAENGGNGVVLIDARTHQVSRTFATGAAGDLALDVSVTGALYASIATAGALAAVDLTNMRASQVPVGAGAAGLAMAGPGSDNAAPQDAEVYVTHPQSNTVTIVSSTRHTTVATVAVPGGPEAVVAPGTGGLAYVTTRAGTVVVIGLSDHQVRGTVYSAPGDELGRMDYDAVTGAIYLTDVTRNQVLALAPASIGGDGGAARIPAEPARATAIPGGPSAVAVTFDGAFGFVTQRAAGSVTMLDLGAHQTLATIPVPGQPVAVVTGAYPPALDVRTSNIIGALLYVLAGASILAVAGYFFGWFGAARRWIAARLGSTRPA